MAATSAIVQDAGRLQHRAAPPSVRRPCTRRGSGPRTWPSRARRRLRLVSARSSGEGGGRRLPRGDVLQVCAASSAAMVAAGVACSAASRAFGSSFALDSLLAAPNVGAAAAAGCLVTALRSALLQVWPDLRRSTDTANAQVLLTAPGLSVGDIVVVACLPAISEEVLFRGGLVGSLGHSIGAAAAVGVLFGALHVSGGRNVASGVFASAAGFLYGLVYISSASALSAAAAHSVGNLTSALVWLRQREHGQGQEQGSDADSRVDER